MRQFFKLFFASLFSLFVFSLLALLIVIWLVVSATQSDKVSLQKNTFLAIDMSARVSEQAPSDEINIPLLSEGPSVGLHEMIAAIHGAIADPSIEGIYLHGRGRNMGMAAADELAAALDSFRNAGKPIVAFSDVMSMGVYTIAHHATHLYVQPGGLMEWKGMHLEIAFFKGLLDKLAVKPEVFYAGDFKSAGEPFVLSRMSEANRLQLTELASGIYHRLLLSVGSRRKIDTSVLHQYANTLAIRTAEQAAAAGLIDGALYHNEVRDTMKRLAGTPDKSDLNLIELKDYISVREKPSAKGERIAVVYAEGAIDMGQNEDGVIGGDSYRKLFARLRDDRKTKAVVLRINSPGGSAIASETLWKELALLQKEKPLVVSMGDYAASGGYYMAVAADTIFVQPNTITGSVGVFLMLLDAQRLLNEKLGITFDAVETARYADLGNPARPISHFERKIIQSDVDTTYHLFKQRVADGRKMHMAKIDSLAQGRVYTGDRAVQLGLADRLGGLQEAIACAAHMAGLESYRIRTYPSPVSLFDKLFGKESNPNATQARWLYDQLPPAQAAWLKQWHQMAAMANNRQTRLPFTFYWP